ncbi:hypothetical protein ABZT04_03635 [Streptomyces sp. NPDC005492]|uniref:hypothetical protein n=1 Tax=Streptomyces sp. NPDC005492 TaxID=3156883 RepID=UPI0033A4F505
MWPEPWPDGLPGPVGRQQLSRSTSSGREAPDVRAHHAAPRALGAPIGPVLYDSPSERLYYAIQTGGAESSGDGLPVRHLCSNSWLVAPGPELMDDWFGGWCELPDDDTLTDPDPDALRAALLLGSALPGVRPPRSTGRPARRASPGR